MSTCGISKTLSPDLSDMARRASIIATMASMPGNSENLIYELSAMVGFLEAAKAMSQAMLSLEVARAAASQD